MTEKQKKGAGAAKCAKCEYEVVSDVQKIGLGRGGLKYYTYWTPGLRPFRNKAIIRQAIEAGMIVYRREKKPYREV